MTKLGEYATTDDAMHIFNTLKRKKELFTPQQEDVATLYSCGPTVYDFAHIGHFRAYVFVDILRRVLLRQKYALKHVMNITDVGHLTDDGDQGEDKIEKKAGEAQMSVWNVAQRYTDDFFSAMEKLNVERPDIVCKATDHINQMIEMVQRIEKNGFTYKTSDGIYFDTSKLNDYGKLAGLRLDELKEGARVEINPEKKNSTDFALWKFSPEGSKRQMEWNSPWGVGFPGWHIECTAMGVYYLGTQIDIHTGGIDHIPVHHTNEIAQAHGAFGRDIVQYWMHNEFITVNGEKMSKSKGNFYTMKDIIDRGFNPLSLRYLFLQAHYRKPINFMWEALQGAQTALYKAYEKISELKGSCTPARVQRDAGFAYFHVFHDALYDDLNTAKTLGALWELFSDPEVSDEEKLWLVLDFDTVLGLGFRAVSTRLHDPLPNFAQNLVEQRAVAREQKDFARADLLRSQLEQAGYEVQDTPQGQVVKKMNKRL